MPEEEIKEEPEEERLTLKSLNKKLEEFKQEVFSRLPPQPLPPVHGFAVVARPEDIAIPATPAKKEIIFHFHDRFVSPRSFSEESHGTDWHEIANQFQMVNEAQIVRREDI